MKDGIHPKYIETKVSCACGHAFVTHSTKPEIKVEVCSNCHPFYTGQQKMIDSEGRVDRFIRRYGLEGRYKRAQKAAKPAAEPVAPEQQ
jgi:large subunit ribosomal protein L31